MTADLFRHLKNRRGSVPACQNTFRLFGMSESDNNGFLFAKQQLMFIPLEVSF